MSKTLNKWLSRKLIKSYIIFLTGTVALFTGKLTGTDWVLMAGLTLGIYSFFNRKDHEQEGS